MLIVLSIYGIVKHRSIYYHVDDVSYCRNVIQDQRDSVTYWLENCGAPHVQSRGHKEKNNSYEYLE